MKSSAEYAASVRRKADAQLRARQRRRRTGGMVLMCVLCVSIVVTLPQLAQGHKSASPSAEYTAYASDAGLKGEATDATHEKFDEECAFHTYAALNRCLSAIDPHWSDVPIPQLPDYRLAALYWVPSRAAIRAEYAAPAGNVVVCTIVRADAAPSDDENSYIYRTAAGIVQMDLTDLPRPAAAQLISVVSYSTLGELSVSE